MEESNHHEVMHGEHSAPDLLSTYMRRIHRFPMLEAGEEYTLAKKWQDENDPKAAEQLIKSHLRLVAKIAQGYNGYGLPVNDLISEGTIGMMHALNKFDPEKGFRLSTYATWWIKAYIKDYVLKSWSLVRLGTTNAQKKLFFSLRTVKKKLGIHAGADLPRGDIDRIAEAMDVTTEEVEAMNQRLSGPDYSLNAPISMGDDAEGMGEWQDWLEDEQDSHDTQFAEKDFLHKCHALLGDALTYLSPREYEILKARRLTDTPQTLQEVAAHLGISRERVRQLEVSAFTKLQKIMKQKAAELQINI